MAKDSAVDRKQTVEYQDAPCFLEPGSYRDRDGRVFYLDGAVYRGLSETALGDWEALSATQFFSRFVSEGKIVRTKRIEANELSITSEVGAWAGYLQHDTIPYISYPFEWSFGSLKDAALLQLELLEVALDEDMVLKDASAYNVQWRGAKPTFIDIPSFERLRAGQPWPGYRQFCQMFVYPLMLQAYKDVPFQPWLRGRLDGIEVEEFAHLMTLRDLARPGVLPHVYLQAKLQKSYATKKHDVRAELRAVGFRKDLIQSNVRGLTKLIDGLSWKRTRSEWSHYEKEHSYSEADQQTKLAFVREVAGKRHWGLVWDLGCNTGTYSRIAAEHAKYVVAMDADALAVERLYQALKSEGTTRILPLVNNLADPSPRLGWRLQERKSLPDRGTPDLTLCLALIHHLVISANIPMDEFTNWLADLGTNVIIEFVAKDDPMVQKLLQNKDDRYSDYEQAYFERCLDRRFRIRKRVTLASGTRTLYYAENVG